MKGRRLLIGVAALPIAALVIHAALLEVARATGGVAALLAPSAAASIAGLLTAVALLFMRAIVIVLLPATFVAFVGFFVTSAVFSGRSRARGPAKSRP